MASSGTVSRFHSKLRTAKSLNFYEDLLARRMLLSSKANVSQIASFTTTNWIADRSKGLIPFDPNDAPASEDLRTPYVPVKTRQKSLWKQTKDGVKNRVFTLEERRKVKHPSLFYRQDHEDKSYLFRAGGLDGHDYYKARRPRSNPLVISGSLMALLVHLMTRDENDLDVTIQKQGWYRLLWLDAPYDSSKDPRSNKGVGKTLIGVPIIGPNTLLNNSKDE